MANMVAERQCRVPVGCCQEGQARLPPQGESGQPACCLRCTMRQNKVPQETDDERDRLATVQPERQGAFPKHDHHLRFDSDG